MSKKFEPLRIIETADEVNSTEFNPYGEIFRRDRVLSALGPIPTLSALGSPSTLSSISTDSSTLITDFTEKTQLLKRIETLSKEVEKAKSLNQDSLELQGSLFNIIFEYMEKETINYIQGKIAEDARDKIKTDKDFRKEFEPDNTPEAFVVSIDIRLSTELMLNTNTPKDFAKFITVLCEKLKSIIIEHGGIFDKFTGDGVLAFFPEFYSGDDAGYRAILAATEAIDFFQKHYHASRNCFRVVKADTGLGIGIDYGTIQFVNIGESLSVVGNPVVYACRLSSTGAGTICINQPAKKIIDLKYKAYTTIEEIEIDIKGSGPIHAYKVRLKGDRMVPHELPWRKKPEDESTSASEPLPNTRSEEVISQ